MSFVWYSIYMCLLPGQIEVVDNNWFLDDAGGGKFQMMDGQTYKYQYVTQSETRVAGSSPSNTTLTMTASLAINVLTACEMELLVSRPFSLSLVWTRNL